MFRFRPASILVAIGSFAALALVPTLATADEKLSPSDSSSNDPAAPLVPEPARALEPAPAPTATPAPVPAPAQAAPTPVSFAITPARLAAAQLDGKQVKLDGRLDEPIWSKAALVTGVTRAEPIEDGQPGFGRAEFRVFYDQEAIYIGAKIVQPAGALRAHVSPRDNLGTDDSINIYVKPVLSSEVGYFFRINPLGIQRDVMAVGYSTLVASWDGVWDSASTPLPDGYSVEVRMPFRMFRFSRDTVQSWGIGFGVRTGSIGETALWPPYSSDRGHQLDQLGLLDGMTGIERGLNLNLTPTLVTRVSQSTAAGGSPQLDERDPFSLRQPGTFDPGLDVQLGVTPGLTANLTLNPDFSQVEADADQLDYNVRYPVLLQEKRPFFLEGFSTFDTPVPLLYSRGVNDPVAGLKFTGTEGRLSVGFLTAWDQDPVPSRISFDPSRTLVPASGFEDMTGKDALTSVARLGFSLARGARVGVLVSDKEAVTRAGEHVASHALAALDARLNLAGSYYLSAQAGGARTSLVDAEATALTGGFYYLDAKREDRHLLVEAETAYYADEFRAETSDLSRVGHAPTTFRLAYKLELDQPWVSYIRPELSYALVNQAGSFSLLDWALVPGVSVQMARNTLVTGSYSRGEEFFNGKTFTIARGSASVSSSPTSWFDGRLSAEAGDRVNYDPADDFLGTSYDLSAGVTLRPTRLLQIDGSYIKSRLYRPDGEMLAANVDIARMKALYNFNARWAIRGISQLNTFRDRWQSSVLLSYVYRPGTVLYLGYQDDQSLADDAKVESQRKIFLKLSYLAWL